MNRPTSSYLRASRPELIIPAGADDSNALQAFIRECLVPVLAEKFVSSRSARTLNPDTVRTEEPTTGALSKEAGQ